MTFHEFVKKLNKVLQCQIRTKPNGCITDEDADAIERITGLKVDREFPITSGELRLGMPALDQVEIDVVLG